jgi:hypothetical protein
MSGLDDSIVTMPHGGGTNLTPEESRHLTRKTNELRDRLAQQCRHLVKPPAGSAPWKRPRRRWTRLAWQQYLDGKGETLDEVKVAEADPDVDAEATGGEE